MSAAPGPAAAPPVTQKREFWVLMGYAVVLGVFGAFAGLVFIGVIKFGGKWYDDSHPGWFGGHWWWVAVAAAAGVVVGLLRRLTRLPWEVPGLFEDLKTEHVDPGLVAGVAVVSAVSLIGGASLGPEKALGTMGGGAGSWIAKRRGLSEEDSQVNTLAGLRWRLRRVVLKHRDRGDADPGGRRPGGQKLAKALAAEIVASSVSFGIELRHRPRCVPGRLQGAAVHVQGLAAARGGSLGLFAAVVVTLLAGFLMAASRLFGRLKIPAIAKPVLGGVVFGVVGVALPLTMFSGSDQLNTVLSDAGTLGLGLLVATLIAKLLTFAVSQESGFVGGPIFPSLFIGGTAGVIVHHVIPGVPLGLAFTCLLAAVPGALAPAPFSMVLMAAFLTQVGALQTHPS